MKISAFAFLAVCAASLLSAADSLSLSGNWKVHNSIAGNESEMACTFIHQESKLTGKCSSDNGAFDIAGKVDGNKVSWSFKTEYNGSPLTVAYEGTVDAAATGIKGSVDVPEASASGDFTAVQSK
jgi:hypothetical protein